MNCIFTLLSVHMYLVPYFCLPTRAEKQHFDVLNHMSEILGLKWVARKYCGLYYILSQAEWHINFFKIMKCICQRIKQFEDWSDQVLPGYKHCFSSKHCLVPNIWDPLWNFSPCSCQIYRHEYMSLLALLAGLLGLVCVFGGAIAYKTSPRFLFLCNCGAKQRLFLCSQIPSEEQSSRDS